MPKIQLPELQALAEYLTKKVPSPGMFSTLKGLIENSPRPEATAQEWSGYLKPGQVASRAGVDFPLKQEELDYSKIPDFLSAFQPNQKISREDVLAHYMAHAPELGLRVGSHAATQGDTREQQMIGRLGLPPAGEDDYQRFAAAEPDHASYSHAYKSPTGAASPFNDRKYQVSVTTSPEFGDYPSHFTPQDISWNRTNRLPTEDFDMSDPDSYAGPHMRLIDEIQSDRHQRALKPGEQFLPNPEQQTELQARLRALASRYPGQEVINALHYSDDMDPENHPILQDPDLKALVATRKASFPRTGYRDPNGPSPQDLNSQIGELEKSRKVVFDSHGNAGMEDSPDIQEQIQNLATQRDRLMKQVPDTPFKTTQGYASMEMRKALNDAIHAGDTGLGLATGKDQTAFYGNRFTERQNNGQSYAYDTTYPPLLRKLAKQYGADFGPMDVKLQPKRSENNRNMWPPRPMRDMVQETGVSNPELHDYIDYIDNDNGDDSEKLNSLARLHSYMSDYLGGLDTGDFNKTWRAASNARSKMNDMIWRANDDHAGENLENIIAATRETPEYKAHQEAYDDAYKSLIDEHLDPVFNQYKARFGPSTNTGPENKTIENTMKLTPEVIERAKKAGIPIWALTGATVGAGALAGGDNDAVTDAAMDNANGSAEGGSVDHVGMALGRMGFAGGGEVKAATTLGQLVQQFLEHYHNFMTMPEDQLSEQHFQKISQLGDQLKSQGFDPTQLLNGARPDPGVPTHADGGSIDDSPDPSSSLLKLKEFLQNPNVGNDLAARAGTSFARQFYGTDKDGHLVLGGRAWTKDQGGTPMGMLDNIVAIPHHAAALYNLAKNMAVNGATKLVGGDDQTAAAVRSTLMPDMQAPQGSDDAAARTEALKAKADQTLGFPKAHTLGEHIADNADVITPIPGLPAEGAASHILGFVGGSNLKNLPKLGAMYAGGNGALEALLDRVQKQPQPAQVAPPSDNIDMLVSNAAKGYADGGYVIPDTGKFPPKEPGEPDNHYQARLKQWQQSRPIPKGPQPDPNFPHPAKDDYQRQIDDYLAANPPQGHAGGGEISLGEKLMALLAKLTGGEAEQAAPAVERRVADPMQQHAQEIASRRWSDNATPDDLFTKVVGQNPNMASLADEIKRRNWLATQANPVEDQALQNANGLAGGGDVTRRSLPQSSRGVRRDKRRSNQSPRNARIVS